MDIILFNLPWMWYNVSLALIAVIFGYLTYRTKFVVLKVLYGIIWILFLPNTIYILTDITHYFEDLNIIAPIYKPALALEYTILILIGIATFLFALYPVEIFLKNQKTNNKNVKTFVFICLNFLTAFGIVLGRVLRANSWDVVFNSTKLIINIYHILISPGLLLLFIFFGLLCNLIFFSFRNLLLGFQKSFFNNS